MLGGHAYCHNRRQQNMVTTSTVPLFQGLLAKAGISRARQISSPFNVQHDVHISVEDLDDILQQGPESWKPKTSPLRLPQDIGEPEDPLESNSQPHTPIYESMKTEKRFNFGPDELAEHLGNAQLAAGAISGNGNPDTPGWLPHIEPVISPRGLMPPSVHRNVRAESVQFPGSPGAGEALRSPHASMDSQLMQMTTIRVPTPVSAPIGSSMARLIDASALKSGTAPRTPVVNANSTASDASANSVPNNSRSVSDMTGGNGPESANSQDGSQSLSGGQQSEKSTKWIKRKSRIVSAHSMAQATKRFSMATSMPTLAAAQEEDEYVGVEPSAPVYEGDIISTNEVIVQPDPAVLDASAEAAASAAASAAATTSTAESDKLNSQGSERKRELSKSSGSVSGKSSKKRRENYGELEEYAEGESGNVYITGRNAAVGKRPKGEYVAVKVVPKTAKARYRKLRTELKILRRIRSQHVVRFYEYFSIDDSVWIVYEFMSRGSITDLLAAYPEIRMPMVTISFAMHEVLTALAYLHERHIIHCDVRSDNVLIDDRGQVKLADFSSA
ncbi:hypothetical protein GGF37_003469, partial [Kickxella alabastrina]